MEQCKHIIETGLTHLNIDANETQVTLLLSFIKLLEKWNKAYNLTAVRQPEAMARLHILDSLSILEFIEGNRVADIGTGAGLPAIPLAILLPEVDFVLVDSNAKKTRFVQQAILELKLTNVSVVHSRVEAFRPEQLFSTITMRAFASLPTIMQLTQHLMNQHGILLAMKGQQPDQAELDAIPHTYSIISLQVPDIEGERCLIKIEGEFNNE